MNSVIVSGKGNNALLNQEQLLHYNSVNQATSTHLEKHAENGGRSTATDISTVGSTNNFRPGSQGNQRVRPNVSAENARRKVKDQIIENFGGHDQIIMGRTAHDSFPNTKSATSQKLYSSQKHLQAFAKASDDRRH